MIYKSKLEKTNASFLKEQRIKEWYYEPKEGKIKYIIPASIHSYTPDFWVPKKDGWIVIETKGIWEYTDRLKHVWIKTQYPTLDLRFVFSSSRTKTSKGAKQTYADICEGRGRGVFRGLKWQYADRKIPLEWLNE